MDDARDVRAREAATGREEEQACGSGENNSGRIRPSTRHVIPAFPHSRQRGGASARQDYQIPRPISTIPITSQTRTPTEMIDSRLIPASLRSFDR